MANAGTWSEANLPWADTDNDRRFKTLVVISLVLFTITWGIIRLLPTPEAEQEELKDVSPRLAKLIIEKQTQPKPPPKPKEQKKEKPKEKKQAEKPKEKKPEPKPEQAARKKAESSGIMAMQDELADLRESFDVASIQRNKPIVKDAEQSRTPTNNAKEILSAKAGQSSGGINTDNLSRSTGGGNLEGRQTTKVHSSIKSGGQAKSTGSGQRGNAVNTRGEEEIELVFQKNKGRIFSMYNRELRRDPTLRGKVVLELTIAPSGRVTKARIVSSELDHPQLERKLVARVKLFRFEAKDVATMTVTYPIDFLPS